jgi:hypothetical protein
MENTANLGLFAGHKIVSEYAESMRLICDVFVKCKNVIVKCK